MPSCTCSPFCATFYFTAAAKLNLSTGFCRGAIPWIRFYRISFFFHMRPSCICCVFVNARWKLWRDSVDENYTYSKFWVYNEEYERNFWSSLSSLTPSFIMFCRKLRKIAAELFDLRWTKADMSKFWNKML